MKDTLWIVGGAVTLWVALMVILRMIDRREARRLWPYLNGREPRPNVKVHGVHVKLIKP